jgi:glycosyltransferase involved in cell wall biosynthesis
MDALSIWGKEFASALGSLTPTIGWIPRLSWTGAFQKWEMRCDIQDPPLHARSIPLQRGYRRWPISALSGGGTVHVASYLKSASGGQRTQPLVLTSPYYADLAEEWQGPVVYYVTDLLIKYGGFDEAQVRRLDARMCEAATLVCPNSSRIANYLAVAARCSREKIVIIPNATRRANLLPQPPSGPGALPEDLADLPRPIAGVIGNLGANMDWEILEQAVRETPWLSWAFIGPSLDRPADGQITARGNLMRMGGRVRFTGAKLYGELASYARAFDVAVLPYRKAEPTYSGSSTRFYEHLAACRPIIATRGFAELLEKEPLLLLSRDAEQMIHQLNRLRLDGFTDGYETLRWKTSQCETWDTRALSMKEALAKLMTGKAHCPPGLVPRVS